MTDFILDGLVAKAKLKPGTYRLFTDGNADLPWGGAVPDTSFVVPEPSAPVEGAGTPGKSAYQSWLDTGHTGTEVDFLASLKGEPGDPGTGAGTPGKSAYQTWLDLGHTGTEADFIASLKGVPGDPGTGDDVSSPFAHPTTMEEMRALIQDAITNNKMVVMDPNLRFNLSSTMSFDLPEGGGPHFGVDWNYAQVTWTGPAGTDANFFEFNLPSGQSRGFNWRNGYFFGGYPTPSFGFAIRIYAAPGTNLMYATVADCTFEFCGGVNIAGNAFESKVLNPEGNGLSRGLVHLRQEGAVVSNITIVMPHAHGCNYFPALDLGDVNSVMIHGGSFIDCHGHGGAISADTGIKYLAGADFENCGGDDGGAAIRMPQWIFGGSIRGLNFSNTGGDMPFGIDYPGVLDANHVLADFSVYQCAAVKP